jgi:hypothetical protein
MGVPSSTHIHTHHKSRNKVQGYNFSQLSCILKRLTTPEDIMKKINEMREQNHNSRIQFNSAYNNSSRRSISINSIIPGVNDLEYVYPM